MENSFVKNLSFDSEKEATKVVLALFGGIAAGAVLAALLVSRNKYNLIDRLLMRGNSNRILDVNNDASFAHPEKYLDAGDDVIVQPT